MNPAQRNAAGGLEFEPSAGRDDLRVSTRFRTPGGDTIRAVVTTRKSVILSPVTAHDSTLDSVIVSGDFKDGVADKGFLGEVWDKAVAAAKIVKEVMGGSSGGCTTETSFVVDGNNRITGIMTTTTCVQ